MEKIRKEYTQENKLGHISQWQTSGKTKVNYCKEAGIAYTTFRHWLDKYHYKKERSQTISSSATEKKASFLAIQIQPNTTIENGKPIMELVFSSGARLQFYQTVPADYLQQLLALNYAKY